MAIYDQTLALLNGLPAGTPAGLLLRHSTRYPILSEEDVFQAALTPEGIKQAEELGVELGRGWRLGRLLSSPVGRCVDTAAAIARGAGWRETPNTEFRLSHPHIEPVWEAMPHVEFRLSEPHIEPVWDAMPLRWPDCALPAQVEAVINLVLEDPAGPGSLDLFVTHDTILAVIAGIFTGHIFRWPDYWPDYLEGIIIWRSGDGLHLRWRDDEKVIGAWPQPAAGQLRLGF